MVKVHLSLQWSLQGILTGFSLGLGTSIGPGRRTSISLAFKLIIATLSSLRGPSPSHRSTPISHVAPPGSALPRNATHASTSSFLSMRSSSSGLMGLKSLPMILPLHPGSRRMLASISICWCGNKRIPPVLAREDCAGDVPSTNFFPPLILSPSFCESRLEAKRALSSNVMVANGTMFGPRRQSPRRQHAFSHRPGERPGHQA